MPMQVLQQALIVPAACGHSFPCPLPFPKSMSIPSYAKKLTTTWPSGKKVLEDDVIEMKSQVDYSGSDISVTAAKSKMQQRHDAMMQRYG